MVVECDGIVMLEASAAFAIPIEMKAMIVEEREPLLEDDALEREQALAAMAEDKRSAGDAGNDVERETDGGEKTLDKGDAAGGAPVETTLHKLALLRYDFSNRGTRRAT